MTSVALSREQLIAFRGEMLLVQCAQHAACLVVIVRAKNDAGAAASS